MHVRSAPATRAAALTIVVLACSTIIGGCSDHRRADFYAIRNVRIAAEPGDGSIIVRAEPMDLLARERRALALSASAD